MSNILIKYIQICEGNDIFYQISTLMLPEKQFSMRIEEGNERIKASWKSSSSSTLIETKARTLNETTFEKQVNWIHAIEFAISMNMDI